MHVNLSAPGARGMSLVLAAAIGWLTFGCGPPPTYPVEGVVKYKGDQQPASDLAGGAVIFTTPDLKESSKGIIASDGKFRLETLSAREGALARKYKVSVIPPVQDGSGKNARSLDPRFASTTTSPIEVEVKEGPNQIEVVVEARGAKSK